MVVLCPLAFSAMAGSQKWCGHQSVLSWAPLLKQAVFSSQADEVSTNCNIQTGLPQGCPWLQFQSREGGRYSIQIWDIWPDVKRSWHSPTLWGPAGALSKLDIRAGFWNSDFPQLPRAWMPLWHLILWALPILQGSVPITPPHDRSLLCNHTSLIVGITQMTNAFHGNIFLFVSPVSQDLQNWCINSTLRGSKIQRSDYQCPIICDLTFQLLPKVSNMWYFYLYSLSLFYILLLLFWMFFSLIKE